MRARIALVRVLRAIVSSGSEIVSSGSEIARAPSLARQDGKDEQLRRDFEMYINGEAFTDKLVHHCVPGICSCVSHDDCVTRVSVVLVKVIFFRRPPTPQIKEWTAVGHLFILCVCVCLCMCVCMCVCVLFCRNRDSD